MKLYKPILLLLAILIVEFACGQIQLLNPSFEGGHVDCSIPVEPMFWNLCDEGIANCSILNNPEIQPTIKAIEGDFILGIRTQGINYNGSISQFVDCGLKSGILYSFNIWMSGYHNDLLPQIKSGQAQVWLSNDTCTRDLMIFESGGLDTIWQQFNVFFLTLIEYKYIHISGWPKAHLAFANVLVDALSPIAVVNAHQVHAGVSDTVFVKGTSACVNLHAYVDTAMGSVRWEQVGAGTISNQLHAGVFCTDTNTTYIVHTLTRDSTCAGYLPSSDTVRVRFVEANSITQQEQVGIRFYPNPANEVLYVETDAPATLFFYNSLGQLAQTTPVTKGKNTIQVYTLPKGVYHVVVQHSKSVVTHKIVVLY